MADTSPLRRSPAWLWLVRLGLLAPAGVAFAVLPGDLLPVLAVAPALVALVLLARVDRPRWLRRGLALSRALGIVGGVVCFLIALSALADPCLPRPFLGGSLALLVVQAGLVRAPAALVEPDPLAPAGGPRRGTLRSLASAVALALVALVGGAILLLPLGRGGSKINRNESMAIGELRGMTSAQEAYARYNGGLFGSLECLIAPTGCLTQDGRAAQARDGYAGTAFFHTEPARRRGYEFTLHVGPEESTADGRKGSRSFAYLAVPQQAQCTGVRAFCMDDTQVLRYSTAGALPPLIGGRCPVSLDKIQ